MKKQDLQILAEKFPKLWAEFPERFHLFFNEDGTMNTVGQFHNMFIKKRHRERIAYKKRQ